MNYDETGPIDQAQPSATERQLRRLVVPEPAAYAPDKRLDVIHEPLLYGLRTAGPFSQREARRRPGLPQSAKGVAGPQKPATPSLEACAT